VEIALLLLANTLYVQSSINGTLSKSIAGGININLTAAEAGNSIFLFTGTLTANVSVVFPNAAKTFIVSNRTSGAFSLTITTTSGTGIIVSQNTQQELISDGTNIVLSSNDFHDVILTGNPTAPTVVNTDNSTTVATTGFVKEQNYITSAGAPVQSVAGRGGDVVLGVTDVSGAAPLDNPALTGIPTTPTAILGTNTTQIASTAFVEAAMAVAPGDVTSINTRKGDIVLVSTDITDALTFTPINAATLGAINGTATLDSSGKLTTIQIPDSLVGAVVYKGVWDASTNNPALTSGIGTLGWYYKVNIAGNTTIDGFSQWNIGDVIIYNGTTWDKIDGLASEVSSVFGRVGAIVMLSSDVTAALGFTPYNDTNPSAYINSAGAPVQSVAGRNGTIVLSVADISGAAPLVSPALTGTPTAPNPALSDYSTEIATTAFVKELITSAVIVSVTGGVDITLNATQASSPIVILTGILTTDISVIVPSVSSAYTISNRTSGAFNITIKTLSGTGIVLAQGYNTELFCDATNVVMSTTDFTNMYIQGNPTTTTQLISDDSIRIATTAYVKSQNYITSSGAPVQSVAGRGGAVTLVVADVSGAAPLDSPSLTGIPAAPTAAAGTNTTQIATTAFVISQNYITSMGSPVQSVAGRIGDVVLTTTDISGTVDGGAY